jgi:hypothetical protein
MEKRLAQAEGEGNAFFFIDFSGVLEDTGKDFSWEFVQWHAIS